MKQSDWSEYILAAYHSVADPWCIGMPCESFQESIQQTPSDHRPK